MGRQRLWWAVLAIIPIFCVVVTIKIFPSVHPIFKLKNMVGKTEILNNADNFINEFGVNPDGLKKAVNFRLDENARSYIQIKKGGKEKFSEIINHPIYSPYFWQVRFFKVGTEKSFTVYLRPDGSLHGFENKKLVSIPVKADDLSTTCRKEIISRYLNVPSEFLKSPDSSKLDEKLSNSIRFEYSVDKNMNISGYVNMNIIENELVSINNSLLLPSGFVHELDRKMEINDKVAIAALIVGVIVLFFFGTLLSLYVLSRSKWLIWKQPLIISGIVGILIFLSELNNFPIRFMSYDGSKVTYAEFIKTYILDISIGVFTIVPILFLYIMMAESMTRKAFPDHIQLWKIGNPRVAASLPVTRRWLLGIFMIPIYFALYFSLSILFTEKLGLYIPSEIEQHFLALKFPWFDCAALGIFTGILEETVFRAVPIAGAALIGDRLGRRKLFIVIGILVETVIFTLMHANHPQIPFYARLLAEVVVTSVALGLIYVKYGIIPGIVLHSTTNLIWASMPLMIPALSEMMWQRVLLAVIALLPLFYILTSRMKYSSWQKLEEGDYNRGWINKYQKQNG